MNNIASVIIYLIFGFILSKGSKFPKDTSQVLNLLIIYLILPSLILVRFPEITFDLTILTPVVSAWVMLLITIAFVLIFSKILNWSKEITGCLLLLIPLGNTSFLGIPMVQSLLGEKAISYAIIYDQLGSFMALSFYSPIVIAFYSQNKNKPNILSVLKKIILFPPFIALLMGILLKFTPPLPAFLNLTFNTLGNMLVPAAMLSVGFQFKGSFERKFAPIVLGTLSFKMIITPIILFSIFKIFNFSGMAESTSILEAGMPPMITAGAVAMSANLAPKLAAALVGLGIIFSFITLPLLTYLLAL